MLEMIDPHYQAQVIAQKIQMWEAQKIQRFSQLEKDAHDFVAYANTRRGLLATTAIYFGGMYNGRA